MANHYRLDATGLWQPKQRFRGVNLGGWFVLERWISPSLFAGCDAVDEYSWCASRGQAADDTLRSFRRSWITRDDIGRIADAGLNAVRLPIGWWTLRRAGPFVDDLPLLEAALRWCEDHELAVQLEVHGLPGGQSAEHHCGQAGLNRWLRDPGHRERSLDLIEELAGRFAGCPALAAIGIANEPDPAIPAEALNSYALEAAEVVRIHLDPACCAVVVPVFTEHRLPELHAIRGMPANTVSDLHYYQCFGTGWQGLDLADHLRVPGRQAELQRYAQQGPLVIGEWSLALPERALAQAADRDQALRDFAEAQLAAYAPASGIFFWTYRTEQASGWSWRDAVANGWLPADLRASETAMAYCGGAA